jgi:hypothetical protein
MIASRVQAHETINVARRSRLTMAAREMRDHRKVADNLSHLFSPDPFSPLLAMADRAGRSPHATAFMSPRKDCRF